MCSRNIIGLLNGIRPHFDITENGREIAMKVKAKDQTPVASHQLPSDDEVTFVSESRRTSRKRPHEELEESSGTASTSAQRRSRLTQKSRPSHHGASASDTPRSHPQLKKKRQTAPGVRTRGTSQQPSAVDCDSAPDETPRKRRKQAGSTKAQDPLARSKSSRPSPSSKECLICCEEYPSRIFPSAPHSANAKCQGNICFACYETHLDHEVNSKRWNEVKCPECTQVLQETEIKTMALDETYMKWLDKAAKACSEADEEFRSCPSATCNWGCFFSPTLANGNIFTCQLCNFRQCIACEAQMHDGETCTAFQQHRETQDVAHEERLSKHVLEKISKPCPGKDLEALSWVWGED